MSRRSWVLFAAMCLIWGIPYLLIRVAVRDVTPGTLVFLRTGIGGLVLLPIAFSRYGGAPANVGVAGGGGFGPVLRRWRPLLAFTVIEIAGPWLLLSDAERRMTSSLSGLLVAAVPLVGVLVARIAGSSERVGPARWLGLALGVAGVAMLVGLDLGHLQLGSLLEVAFVVVGYAVAPVIMANYLADLPSIPTVSASLLLTALGYLPYAVFNMPSGLNAKELSSIVVLGLVCTALAFVLFFALIAQIGPARATVITYVNPAVAVLLGVLMLGESFTLGMAIGFPLILVGSVLAARHERPAEVPAELADAIDQSMRTVPDEVSNSAASSPVPSSSESDQSSSMPSSRC
ncbi:MAG TPA: DMT family transporter [Jatrophihabitantaceae bacterium]|nr:DMT family transporter [Jatrophihabitantaceae bacterium]